MSGWGPSTVTSKLNKFEHVNIWRGVRTRGRRVSLYRGKGSLYGEIQCIMSNGLLGPLVDRHRDPTENITFPQLRSRVVKKSISYYSQLESNHISCVFLTMTNKFVLDTYIFIHGSTVRSRCEHCITTTAELYFSSTVRFFQPTQ